MYRRICEICDGRGVFYHEFDKEPDFCFCERGQMRTLTFEEDFRFDEDLHFCGELCSLSDEVKEKFWYLSLELKER